MIQLPLEKFLTNSKKDMCTPNLASENVQSQDYLEEISRWFYV